MSQRVKQQIVWTLMLSLFGFAVHAKQSASEQIDPQLFVADNGLILFDGETLERRWHRLKDQQTFAPAVIDDRLLVSGTRGLYALTLDQGDILWHLPAKHTGFPVVVDGGKAYLASRDGSLTAIDSRSGDERWQVEFPGWVYHPALAGGLLFTGGSDGTLWAVARNSGETVWSRPLGQEMVYSPLALADGQVVVTTYNREILSFDHAGRLLWRQRQPGIMTTPIPLGKQLIFSGLDQVLRAVDAASGRLLWQRPLPEPLALRLESQQGVLLAALESGRIWLIEGDTGRLRQEYLIPGEPVAGPWIHKGEMFGFINAFGGPKPVVATRLKQSEKR